MDLTNAAPLGIALLGLGLGMRHATDADHVIAVTTIVSRERRIGAASRIGLVWGIGHTLTVMTVGVAIGLASGLMSLVFGLIVVYQITFVDGLFGAFPSWTPR